MLLEWRKISELVNCLDFEWQLVVWKVHLYISVYGYLFFMKMTFFVIAYEVRKFFTCIKLSSICIGMPMMGWPVQKVWGLIPLGGSEFFPCPTLTKETSLSKTCLVWLVWERKTLCFLSKFSTWMEWPLYSETEKTVNPRNIYGMLCVPKEKAN